MEIAIAQAKAKLTQLVAAAERGERVVITRHGKPVAQLTRPAQAEAPRRDFSAGSAWRKKHGLDGPPIPLPDDFDDPDWSLELLGLK
jgi:antitoxin (DNA-binding transcriptional repressor) of toxin-antitoxin stability system